MISVSSSFKTNATKPVRNINAKISIGSVDYGIEDIVSLDISRSTRWNSGSTTDCNNPCNDVTDHG
ncbi:MAG: hypothetical protein BHW21_04505 [Eubacterium sp. 45_250]|nr:MAG: hypothetical protein BHW21_04505 [Eubacterium sp. 45_250]